MRPVVTVSAMQAADRAAAAETAVLVQRAGTALATVAVDLLGGTYGRRVAVLAGPGNNGADGTVAARRLARRGARVTVLDARHAPERIEGVDLVVDAAFGTGFRGSWSAPAVAAGVAVLACDIPSGVDGDTGEARGRPLQADATVTFAAWKPGLLQGDGPALAGAVTVADIGLDAGPSPLALVEDADTGWLAPRPRDGHKWQSAVAVVAGSPGMAGAAALCAHSAYRAGAGMVRLGVPGASPADLPSGEAVGQALPAEGWAGAALAMADRCRVLVVGPGLGRGDATATEVRQLVARCPVPVVVDADGLVALGDAAGVAEAVAGHPGRPVILTPHAGEYARLAGDAPGADRVAAARRLAGSSRAVVLVKGSTTVVADAPPADRIFVCTAGSSRLATAGTGDVLSGMVAAFCARGLDAAPAAALAAHVHGRAAATGPAVGLVAGDLPELVAAWLSERSGG